YLTVVSSGAPELEALRGRELVQLIAEALTERLGSAELLWSRVSREPTSTIAVRPGSERERPGVETSRPHVVRAGAWTATGWPPAAGPRPKERHRPARPAARRRHVGDLVRGARRSLDDDRGIRGVEARGCRSRSSRARLHQA